MSPPSYESSLKGWRLPRNQPSLAEAFETVPVPEGASSARKLLAFLGPGYLVAVGYMDPGNWATDLAGGSAFGYTLLSVILISNFMAILLQALAARLGLVTGRDLAQACRDHYPPLVSHALWVLCEIAICACDLAEVLGTAIALNLLFNIPLSIGVLITLLDVFFVLWLLHHGYRLLEAFIITLVLITGICFAFELFLAQPAIGSILAGLWPSPQIVQDPHKLLIAVGILGATVMPHNLYLHSSLVQTRRIERTPEGLKQSLRFATVDSTVALFFALFINASILILAASVFHSQGHTEIAEIQDAYHLLAPLLGTTLASTLFAVALLTSGLNSAVTATLAGQIVMEGFLNLKLPPWLRRLVTRSIAIVPAFIAATWFGEKGVAQLLIFSQVILSLQLPFAVVPLLRMTGDQNKMGAHAMSVPLKICAWLVASTIIILNVYLLWSFFFSA